MRQFIDPAEDREGTNHWLPISNIVTVAVLFVMVALAAGVILFGNAGKSELTTQGEQTAQGTQTTQGTRTTQGEQTAQSVQAEQVEKAAAELKVREAALADRERTLAESETALKELAGARTVIINELTEKLSALNLPIEINKVSGNIRFTEAVLFDVNMDVINVKGQQYLKTFVPSYLSVLLNSNNEKYLDQIIIEGHADNGGTYQYNLDLSRKRADSVANFILTQNLAKLPGEVSADKYLTVSARSFNVPVLVDGVTDRNKSRRVEFVFRLKDEDILKQMQDLYKGAQK